MVIDNRNTEGRLNIEIDFQATNKKSDDEFVKNLPDILQDLMKMVETNNVKILGFDCEITDLPL